MTRFGYIGTFALAAATALAVTSMTASAAQKCVMAGGEATMVTEDLAKFMAEAALKNSISGMSAQRVGKVDMKCKNQTINVYCIAKQKACK